jgi:hypothetical protein
MGVRNISNKSRNFHENILETYMYAEARNTKGNVDIQHIFPLSNVFVHKRQIMHYVFIILPRFQHAVI